jgi:hypothetical protein
MTANLTLTPEDCELLLACSPFPPSGTWQPGRRDRFIELVAELKRYAALVPPPLNGDRVWHSSRWTVRARSNAEALRMLESANMRTPASRLKSHWVELPACPVYVTGRGVWHNVGPESTLSGKESWVKVWPK